MGQVRRVRRVRSPFSLAATCGPVVWGGGRWPDVAWQDGTFIWAGREDGAIVHREVRQVDDVTVAISGTAAAEDDAAWLAAVLGVEQHVPAFPDPVLTGLARRWAGMRPFAAGSLVGGLVTSIVGQSVSVAAAAMTVHRLAALFDPGVDVLGRRMIPLPDARHLATADVAALRGTGMTWRRAEALVAMGRAMVDETAPGPPPVGGTDALRAWLRSLPLVGPWTAESALLWGLGEADVHPTGDAALLRAARAAYDDPELDHRRLDRLAATWRPNGGWAARLLWLELLGPAPAG